VIIPVNKKTILEPNFCIIKPGNRQPKGREPFWIRTYMQRALPLNSSFEFNWIRELDNIKNITWENPIMHNIMSAKYVAKLAAISKSLTKIDIIY
jgi:hypothetical protein